MSNAFNELFKNGRLHHAYAIAADADAAVEELISGIGKAFKIKTRGNPDVRVRELDAFGIDDARALKEWASIKPAAGERKFYIVRANSFTVEAQNALLKTLEEPAAGTHFFFLVPRTEALLDTVRSRVFMLRPEAAGRGSDDAVRFARLGLAERLKTVKELADAIAQEEKTKEDAIGFLSSLEGLAADRLRANRAVPELADFARELFDAKRALAARGASVKIILEHIALMLPIRIF